MGFEGNGQMSYGLRENPKKSWKSAGSGHVSVGSDSSNQKQENQCKVCFKDFESQKALFGHMRHHSGTRIPCKDCGRTFLSLKSLSNHSRLHSEESRYDLGVKKSSPVLKTKKRSKRKRYNLSTSSSVSSWNDSLPLHGIDQQVEQAARCLMMMSWGVCNRVFSDDDSESFEVGPLNDSEFFKMEKSRESLVALYEKRYNNCVQEVCAGFESIEKKKIELEVSIERLYKDVECGNFVEVESGEDLMKEVGFGIMRLNSRKKEVSFVATDAEFAGDFDNNAVCDTTSNGEIKCKTCNKIFDSRRALAGHQRIHGPKAPKPGNSGKQQEHTSTSPETEAGCKLVKIESLANSMELEMGGGAVKEEHVSRESKKKHKCPMCFKDFLTVQALGGHRRVHQAKRSRRRMQQRTVIEQDKSETCGELDLKTPTMPGEEDNGDAGSKPQAHEPMVSLVAAN